MELRELERHRRTAQTAIGPISYLDTGDPDTDAAGAGPHGRTALFVHGVASNALLWRNAIGELAGEYRCVALDLPLHGKSPAAAGQDLSLTGLADAVEAFCDTVGLDRIDLVANDTGGGVAQIVAARKPERLRTLALTNCETHDNVPPEAFKPTVELAAAGQLSALAPALLADLATARDTAFSGTYEHPELVSLDIVRSYLEPVLGTPEHARDFERLLVSLDPEALLAVEPVLETLAVPTVVVWGTDDPNFPLADAYWLQKTIPGVTEVVEVRGGRLFFPDERAPELAAVLRRHWNAHP